MLCKSTTLVHTTTEYQQVVGTILMIGRHSGIMYILGSRPVPGWLSCGLHFHSESKPTGVRTCR